MNIEEIKEGMYVKYTRGLINGYVPPRIAKITDCPDKDLIKIDNGQVILRNDILKASKNIIGLIKEKDLVKIEYYSLRYEKRVTRLFEVDYIDKDYLIFKNAYCTFQLKNNEWSKSDKQLEPIIKEFLTKEQFENMSYKVGE